jgi:hypothetical protein
MHKIDKNIASNQPSDSGVTVAVDGENSGDERQHYSGRRTKPRKDRNRLHSMRSGIQSRSLIEALVKHGVNIRWLRGMERLLRAELQPRDMVAKMFFDRAWSCYLRCLLIAIVEKDIFAANNQPANFEERLRQANLMAQATGGSGVADKLPPDSSDLLHSLLIIQRYDCHFWHEFCRALSMLLALRDTGVSGLTVFLHKPGRQNKDILGKTND